MDFPLLFFVTAQKLLCCLNVGYKVLLQKHYAQNIAFYFHSDFYVFRLFYSCRAQLLTLLATSQGFHLAAITNPLSLDAKDIIIKNAVLRVLKAESESLLWLGCN